MNSDLHRSSITLVETPFFIVSLCLSLFSLLTHLVGAIKDCKKTMAIKNYCNEISKYSKILSSNNS